MPEKGNPLTLFLAKVEKGHGPHSCWEWTAAKDPWGYGRFGYQGQMRPAPRVAWALLCGNGTLPPKGDFVCHHCDNPGCVNPSHLFIGSHTDNVRDMVAKNRHAKKKPHGDKHWTRREPHRVRRGEDHPMRKLSLDDVHAIRNARMAGETSLALSERYGLHRGTVLRCINGQAWGLPPLVPPDTRGKSIAQARWGNGPVLIDGGRADA